MCNSGHILYSSARVQTIVLFFVVSYSAFSYFPERFLRYAESRNYASKILIPYTNKIFDVYDITVCVMF